MLDVLLKNQFYRKCKAAIKKTKARIDIVKRKRNAMQKYLKNDVADLLKHGLDSNAFARAEGLFVELNLTSCYDLADKFCDYILDNLSVISKQRECPEECKEVVASLIFAAARFADLPNLRDLRSMFTERYGNSLDCYVSKEFVEKLKATNPTKEATLELMQDIATEAGVIWDSKATKQKSYNPTPAPGQARSNVGDKFQTRETPKDDKLSYKPIYPKQKNYLKAIQEDITGRKEQETEPETRSHVHKEEFDYNPIPRYTKSRVRDHRNNDGRKLRVDSRKEFNAEHRKKVKKPPRLDEDQVDEERCLDRLLMHYSRNRNKPYNIESTKSSPKQGAHSIRMRRGASLNSRATRAEIEGEGANKQGHIRSISLQPERVKGGHVHPKLPDDYDDFLAHLEAIRNGGK